MTRFCLVAVVSLALVGCAVDRYAAREPSQAVADAQGQLSGLGYYAGPLDGLWNPSTEEALARFQGDHRLAAGAALDEATVATLRTVSSSNAIEVSDAADIAAIQTRLMALGYYTGPLTG